MDRSDNGTEQTMEFEWDDRKNTTNIKKHGISFEDAKIIFNDFIYEIPDDRYNYYEIRYLGLGMIHNKVIVVAFSEPKEGCIRIISARDSNKKEREMYFYERKCYQN